MPVAIAETPLLAEARDEASARLVRENHRLRRENSELRSQIRRLQAAVDAHVARAQRAGLFGPVELTAGTSVGPSWKPR